MAPASSNLAALIGSRICHDLISPIGAINNGIELLGMAGSHSDGPEMSLISESVGNASARIRFFRVAFGAAGEQQMGRAEVTSILNDLYAGGRLTVAWGPMDPAARSIVRMCFLAIQCLETAMPFGGRIEITGEDNTWDIRGTANKINVDPDLWALLVTPDIPSNLQPAQVQFALLPTLAHDAGRSIVSQSSDTSISMQF